MTTWPGTSIPESTRNAFDWLDQAALDFDARPRYARNSEKENPPVSTAEIKPATRTSPFYWRDGYEQKINWSGRKKADETRIVANKEMVAGQDYELNNIPRTGSLRDASAVLRRRGDVGRKKLRGAP